MTECFCDYDWPEFYRKTSVLARKQHRCEECGSPILPGERYELAVGKWDGDFKTFATCPDCVELRDHLADMPCFCWAHGGLWEDITNQFENADFKLGERFAYLRMVVEHRWYKRRKLKMRTKIEA